MMTEQQPYHIGLEMFARWIVEERHTRREAMTPLFAAETDYADLIAVQEAYPSAVVIEPVTGGWRVFFTVTDYETWTRQR